MGARGRPLQVEDSTYQGPEVTEVTECLVQAKKWRKPVQLSSWRKRMVRCGMGVGGGGGLSGTGK